MIVYHRNAYGILEPRGTFPTGGNGLGNGPNPLGSQYSLVLSGDNRMLFAVNAGSDSITAFAVSGDSLTSLQTISSGGTQPVSPHRAPRPAVRAKRPRRNTQHHRFPDRAGSTSIEDASTYRGLDAIAA